MDRVRRELSESARSVPIVCKVQKDIPDVLIDPEQVSMTVGALLINAHQAARRQLIQVTARIDPDDNHLILLASDGGRGMDQHTVTHAFDPFFSARKAGRRTGMGLARAHRWTRGHGGTLVLRSTPDKGTVAAVTLPLQAA